MHLLHKLAAVCAVPLLVLATASAVAVAAPKAGSYKGTSSGKIEVRVADPVLGVDFKTQTDTGKVAFRVAGSVVRSFALKGQKAPCGGQNIDVDIKLASIKLSAAGAGSGTYTHPNLGPQKVSIKVGSSGKATGTVRFTGLCKGTASFKAQLG